MTNSFEHLKESLKKVAEEFDLDYEELEKLYLQDIKDFIDNAE